MGAGRDGSVMVQTAPGLLNGRVSLDKPSLEHGGFGAAARASIEATLRRASGEAICSSEPPAQPALRPDDEEAWARHEPVTEVSGAHTPWHFPSTCACCACRHNL
jgi:hypothetical protein